MSILTKGFLKKHFGESNGILFKCDPAQLFGQERLGLSNLEYLGNDSSKYFNSYELKSKFGWNKLVSLIEIINFKPELLHTVLNVDEILWAFALNTTLCNYDSYNGFGFHNFYLYMTGDGIFHYIPCDLNESFGGALIGSFKNSKKEFYSIDPFLGASKKYNYPLLNAILKNPEYKKRYSNHIRTIIENNLTNKKLNVLVKYLQNQIVESAKADSNNLFNLNEFYLNVDSPIFNKSSNWEYAGIFSTVNNRKDYLLNNKFINSPLPKITDLNINSNLVSVNVQGAKNVWLMYREKNTSSVFQKIKMIYNNTDLKLSQDKCQYSVFIPLLTNEYSIEFYIMAENDYSVVFEPKKAETEYFIYEGEHSPN